jgi:hypothetical protein
MTILPIIGLYEFLLYECLYNIIPEFTNKVVIIEEKKRREFRTYNKFIINLL